MAAQTRGQWKPLNTKSIIASVERVFKTGDISKLTKVAYNHIIQHMSFIAHYDVNGFRAEYESPVRFAQMLLTSEYSLNPDHNWRQRDRYVQDKFFADNYGLPYCQSVADANRGVLIAARKYLGVA